MFDELGKHSNMRDRSLPEESKSSHRQTGIRVSYHCVRGGAFYGNGESAFSVAG
jgi:hypothetical protein